MTIREIADLYECNGWDVFIEGDIKPSDVNMKFPELAVAIRDIRRGAQVIKSYMQKASE